FEGALRGVYGCVGPSTPLASSRSGTQTPDQERRSSCISAHSSPRDSRVVPAIPHSLWWRFLLIYPSALKGPLGYHRSCGRGRSTSWARWSFSWLVILWRI